jgi:hypothetical protein
MIRYSFNFIVYPFLFFIAIPEYLNYETFSNHLLHITTLVLMVSRHFNVPT